MRPLIALTLAATCYLTNSAIAEPNAEIAKLLEAAKPGQTVELPAGEFKGSVTLPPGVSLKGAGFEKTVIDAAGDANGIAVDGGDGARISDLTIRNAKSAGVTVRNATAMTLTRVRATQNGSGLMLRQVEKGRIENCLVDRGGFGIAVSGGADCVVVNCTVAACSEIGLSLAASPNLTAFNNCVVGSSICVNIDQPEGMHIDHNLYFGTYLGAMREQIPRKMVTAWHYLSGLDAHSLRSYVEFKNLDAGDCTPTTVTDWALDRAITGDWGTTELAGVKAPETDMLGRPRAGRPDIGAVETTITPPRTADGQFTVSSDVGLKSAGVFTKTGTLIAYLFHNLPLPKGSYSFWLPVRDYVGQPIPPGGYEVRLAESDFQWKYIDHVGDNGDDRPMPHSAPFTPQFVCFAPNGILVLQVGLSEDHATLRGYDVKSGKQLWVVLGGGEAQGIDIDHEGMLYALSTDYPQGQSRLTRVETATGKIIPWPNAPAGHNYPTISPKARSLALLGDRFYVADQEGNKLVIFNKADGKIASTLPVKSPSYVAGDEKAKLLWVVSAGKIVALTPEGTQVAESSAIEDPMALTVREGQLAVTSGKTGKITWFDAADPNNLKRLREFGRGDGPYGAYLPDRFLFQKAPKWQSLDYISAAVALGPEGKFAVVDYRRTQMFDDAGKNLWYTIGVFGSWSHPSFSTENRRFWDSMADISFRLNEQDGTWAPEAFWDHSLLTPAGLQERNCIPLGDFKDGDKNFFVFISCSPGAPFGPPKEMTNFPIMTVARIDNFKTIPVLRVTVEGGRAVMREDTNGDGDVTQADTPQALVDAQGKPLPAATLFFRFSYLEPDGSIIVLNNSPSLWKRTGLNAKGVPVYEGKNYLTLLDKDWKKELSPYDFKPDYTFTPGNGFVVGEMLSDGGFVVQATVRGSGGAHMNNGAGTDLCGYGPDGKRRWMHPLAQHRGIAGMGTVDDITLTAAFVSTETILVDIDGLGLGGFCEPRQLYYPGYWIDQPNIRLFKMPDNHLHATIGDDCSGRHPWFRLDNQESMKRTKQPVQVSAERARELTATEFKPPVVPGRPPVPKLRIKRLEQPLPIDGDLAKWRTAGIEPQVVIGPSGSFNGASDCSAVVRMAYEGQNLYFQVLNFDDTPIFYKTVYQNSVELGINPPSGNGFQFVIHRTPEGKDIIWRNRFFASMARDIDAQHAPRVVRVLDNAKDVPERELLEGLYGEDLSNAKVVVTEFKIPIDKTTYSGAEGDIFQLGPGKTFGFGIYVNDSDRMYTDEQHLISWPVTFNVFCALDDQAQVTCE